VPVLLEATPNTCQFAVLPVQDSANPRASIHTALGLQRARVRALTVRAGHLAAAADGYVQLTLDRTAEDRRRLEPVLDKANGRYGSLAVRPASLITPSSGSSVSRR